MARSGSRLAEVGSGRRLMRRMSGEVSRSRASSVSSCPRGWWEPRARASSASARLSVVLFLRARFIFASFVFIE